MGIGEALQSTIESSYEQLKQVGFEKAAALSGATYDEAAGVIDTVLLGRPCRVSCRDGSIQPVGHEKRYTAIEQCIVLKYLSYATGRALSGRNITFRDVRNDGAFESVMLLDARMREFDQVFGKQPALLHKALETVEGERLAQGDAAIRVMALARVPVSFVVWGEEDGIPASSTVLFDACVTSYLPAEYVGVTVGVVVGELLCAVEGTC